MGVKLGGMACCCAGDCCTFSDNFNRADSDTVGTGWTETSGDWDIVSNKVSISATGTLTNTSCATITDGDGSGRPADFDISFTVSSPTDDVTIKGGMHDILAVLDFTANTVGLEGAPSVCTETLALAANTAYTVRVIWKDPVACVFVNGACVFSQKIDDPDVAAANPTLRVTANPSSSAVTFDEYSLKVHDVNTNCIPSCESLDCGALACSDCAANTTPRRYQVVIAGVALGGLCTADCANYNGTFILEQCYCRALTHADECATGGATPIDECAYAIGWTHGSVCSCFVGPPTNACNEHRDWIRLTVNGTALNVLVFGDFVLRLEFENVRAVGDSCIYTNQSVTFKTSGTTCDTSAATCTVTSLED